MPHTTTKVQKKNLSVFSGGMIFRGPRRREERKILKKGKKKFKKKKKVPPLQPWEKLD